MQKSQFIRFTKASFGLFLFAAGLWFTACKEETTVDPAADDRIRLGTNATLGSYLTDADNNTLYYFTRDVAGTNSCAGGCASLWPIFYEANLTQDKLPEGLQLSDFAEITTASGAKQTTYKGWPLYYYAPSTNGQNVRELPGETKGEGVGTVWYVAKPDYTIMLANAQLVGADGKNYKSDYTEGTGVTQYFTDNQGRALYTFANDKKNKNNCTSATCQPLWPVFAGTNGAVASVPSALNKSLFGSIDVPGGKQITYKGWPLYYFAPLDPTSNRNVPEPRGKNQGVSYPRPSVWPVAVKDAPEAPNP